MAHGSRQAPDVTGLWAIRLILISTAVFLPGALNRWVLPKEAVAASAIALATTAPAAGRLPRWFWAVVGVGSVILVSAALMSAAPLAQLFGRFPRYEGLIALPVYVGAAWAGARLLGPATSAARLRVAHRTAAGVALAFAAVSALEAAGIHLIPTDLDRPGALAGNATDQGTVGVLLFGFLLPTVLRAFAPAPVPAARRRGGRKRSRIETEPFPWWEAGGLAAAVLTVLLSASRAAFFALTLVFVIALVLELRRAHRIDRAVRRPLVLGGLIGLAAIGAVALILPLMRERLTGQSPLASATIADRGLMAGDALELLRAHPFLGVGPSGFIDAVPDVQGADWFALVGSTSTLDSPHDWMLQAAMAGGIPLLVVAIAAAAWTAFVGIRGWNAALVNGAAADADRRAAAGIAVIGFTTVLLTHFTIGATAIPAALMLGALIARPPAPTPAPGGVRPIAVLRTGLVAVWAAALLVTALGELPMGSGVAAASGGDVAGARTAFDVATGLRPWDADALSIAAQTFAQTADAAGDQSARETAAVAAVGYASAALERTPRSVAAEEALIVGLQYSGELETAREHADALANRLPYDIEPALRLASIVYDQGDTAAAVEALLDAADRDPTDARPWRSLAQAYADLGDTVAAADAAERANRLESAD